MSSRSVWMVTRDASLSERVSRSLGGGSALALEQCPDLGELARRLEQGPCAAALVDLDPEPGSQMSALEPLVERFDKTRFVMVATEVNEELLLRAMRCGARQVLLKGTLDREMGLLARKLGGNASNGQQARGKAITVLSAGGGCGATTLAISLADELRQITRSPALLMDMDLAYGAVASYLGIESSYGLGDIFNHPRAIDTALIHSTVAHHSEHLHVLVSPASRGNTDPLGTERLRQAMDCCLEAYRWTVVDAPRLPLAVCGELGAMSECVLIVYQLTVKDIRMARTIQRALLGAGVEGQKIRYVANRYHRRRAVVCLEDANRALGGVESICITNDYSAASQSLNFSELLSSCAPRSWIRRDVQRLAASFKATNGHAAAAGSH